MTIGSTTLYPELPMRMRHLLPALACVIASVFVPVQRASAQTRDSSAAKARPVSPIRREPTAASPCCGVVKIDAAARIVTARVTATGYTFRFEVKDRRLLSSIKVADKVWADFAAKTVKLRATDIAPCCGIISMPSRVQ